MKCCDTCAHFVLLPSSQERVGWCNKPIPLWVDVLLERHPDDHASLMSVSDGSDCQTWEDATP